MTTPLLVVSCIAACLTIACWPTCCEISVAAPPDTVFDLCGSPLEPDDLPLVVPTLTHLVALGNPIQIRDHLRSASHEVVIAVKPAERTC
ncbi:hypothetical protein [Kribbella sp.]|uniref:hypothetical protein n=1 Tax=Kribbella sp. TaxID=1871183 RepID=UPI002D6AFCA5|nr:hypothetical protein [Kribbella sp.]HZX08043.1 hypothetical protein [Kribbella sp.]